MGPAWRPFFVAMLACMVCGHWLFYYVFFPKAEVPRAAAVPRRPREWPASATMAGAGMCGFRPRSRFAIASVLFGSEEFRQYAMALGASAAARASVDFVLLTMNSSAMPLPWRACAVPGYRVPHPQFLKLLAWNMTEYEAVLVLDLDTLVLGDLSPLFEAWPGLLRKKNLTLAAAYDQPVHWSVRWTPSSEVRFNAGVMLVVPDRGTFEWLMQGLTTTMDWPTMMHEQGYLNRMFAIGGGQQYAELSPIYNAMITTAYAEPYEWNRLIRAVGAGGGIRILHFTFPKPHLRDLCEEYLVEGICALWPSAGRGPTTT